MANIELLYSVFIITLLGAMTPGPDFIITANNSVTYSRKSGFFTSIGIACGLIVHILYSIAGVTLLIAQSLLLFNLIKFLGAGYLIYTGLKSFISKKSHCRIENTKKADISNFKALKMGFFSNALNPKTSIFFLGLFTIVVSPTTPYWVLSVMTLIMLAETIIWFSIVSLLFSHNKLRSNYLRFENLFNKIFGGLLVVVGIKIILLKS